MSSSRTTHRRRRPLTKADIETYLKTLKQKAGVRVYTPYKYFAGLTTKTEVRARFQEILRGRAKQSKDPSAYTGFVTDYERSRKGAKHANKPQGKDRHDLRRRPTRTSKYTQAFYETYGCAIPRSMEEKSRVTGVPYDVLKRVYNKGKAAWRTGHRVGANEEQWGYARVHSFLTLGCTVFASDFRLFEEALERMTPAQRRRWLSLPIQCSKATLESPYYRRRHALEAFMKLKRRYRK